MVAKQTVRATLVAALLVTSCSGDDASGSHVAGGGAGGQGGGAGGAGGRGAADGSGGRAGGASGDGGVAGSGIESLLRPAYVISTGGHPSPAQAQSRWDQYVAPFYDDWIGIQAGTHDVGIWVNMINWSRFYHDPTVEPADATDPGDPNYDWSILDGVLGLPMVSSGLAAVHWRLGWEGNRLPAWLATEGYTATPDTTTLLDLSDPAAIQKYEDFMSAVATRYGSHPHIRSLSLGEMSGSPTSWQDGKVEIVLYTAQALPSQVIWLFQNVNIKERTEILSHPRVHYAVADARMFFGTCGSSQTVFPVYDCDPSCGIGLYGSVQCHNGTVAAPQGGYPKLVWVSSEDHGWFVVDSNPWPGNPVQDPMTNPATPAKYAWYHSAEGVIPSHMLTIAIGGDRHSEETPDDWDAAFTQFGPATPHPSVSDP